MTQTQTQALVETVSINYEDFNDSFLTCSTCLSMYDGAEHPPKLLPCSHTVSNEMMSLRQWTKLPGQWEGWLGLGRVRTYSRSCNTISLIGYWEVFLLVTKV